MCNDSNPCFVRMLENTYRELTLISARYTRIVVVRLDLKLGDGTFPWKVDISNFRKTFVKKLQSEYKSKVAYQWVREFGKSGDSDATHWHWWVAVKASDTYKPTSQARQIRRIINDDWIMHTGNSKSYANLAGFFDVSRKFFSLERRERQQETIANGPAENKSDVLINRNVIAKRDSKDVVGGVIDECFFALSYMSKVYTKTRTENTKGKPVFKSSNLNTKDIREGRQEKIEQRLSDIRDWLRIPLEPKPLTFETKVRIKDEDVQSELTG